MEEYIEFDKVVKADSTTNAALVPLRANPDDEWVVIPRQTGFDEMHEVLSVRNTLPAAQNVVRASTLLNGVVDGATYGAVLTATLAPAASSLATMVGITLPPILVFALATGGVIMLYNLTTAALTSKEQRAIVERLLSEQAQDLADVLERVPKDSVCFFMNSIEQSNPEVIAKIIRLTLQLTHLNDPAESALIQKIFTAIAQAANINTDDPTKRRTYTALCDYLIEKNPKFEVGYRQLIARLYSFINPGRSLQNSDGIIPVKSKTGDQSTFFKTAAPKLQSTQNSALAVTRHPVITHGALVAVGVDCVLGEQAKKSQASHEEAKSELTHKVRLLDVLCDITLEKEAFEAHQSPLLALMDESDPLLTNNDLDLPTASFRNSNNN